MFSVRSLLKEFEDFEECDAELKALFHELFPDPKEIKKFWTFLDNCMGFEGICTDVLQRIPKTVNQFKKLGLTVKHCYMISVIGNEHSNIHIDPKTNPVRIHWPVYNENSVITKWFSYSGDWSTSPLLPVDGDGPPYLKLDESKCTLINQTIMKGPTAFRVDIPHCVVTVPNSPLPRVAFSFSFNEQSRVNEFLL